ncbi:MAG TPA: ABC transporter ATP-binding protein [Casimicrobiaceae bacterium]|jgi:NitT/TauT family transport system ATP-binding protein
MLDVVEASGVAKVYPNGTAALAPVDLAIAPGELVTLLGPSGCGKTTLLNLIAGLIEPSAGALRWWGSSSPPAARPDRRVGFVFQSPTLMPWARVSANVRLPLDLAGIARTEGARTASQALAQVGLGGFERHLPRELSGGMQMRVSIARALAVAPDLLLMDEPFGALDEFTRQRLDDDLLALWQARGLTVVFVTHSIQEAVFLSTRIVVMGARPGRILTSHAIDEPYPRGDAFRVSTRFAEHARALSTCVAEAGARAAAGS